MGLRDKFHDPNSSLFMGTKDDPLWWGYLDDDKGWTARPKSEYMKSPEYNSELRHQLKQEKKQQNLQQQQQQQQQLPNQSYHMPAQTTQGPLAYGVQPPYGVQPAYGSQGQQQQQQQPPPPVYLFQGQQMPPSNQQMAPAYGIYQQAPPPNTMKNDDMGQKIKRTGDVLEAIDHIGGQHGGLCSLLGGDGGNGNAGDAGAVDVAL